MLGGDKEEKEEGTRIAMSIKQKKTYIHLSHPKINGF